MASLYSIGSSNNVYDVRTNPWPLQVAVKSRTYCIRGITLLA